MARCETNIKLKKVMKWKHERNVTLLIDKLRKFIIEINKEGFVVTPNNMESLYKCLETGRCNTSSTVYMNGRFMIEKCSNSNWAASIVDLQSSNKTCVTLNDTDLRTCISLQQLYNIM